MEREGAARRRGARRAGRERTFEGKMRGEKKEKSGSSCGGGRKRERTEESRIIERRRGPLGRGGRGKAAPQLGLSPLLPTSPYLTRPKTNYVRVFPARHPTRPAIPQAQTAPPSHLSLLPLLCLPSLHYSPHSPIPLVAIITLESLHSASCKDSSGWLADSLRGLVVGVGAGLRAS